MGGVSECSTYVSCACSLATGKYTYIYNIILYIRGK